MSTEEIPAQAMVRALFRAIPMAAHSALGGELHLKVYYPALYEGSPEQKNTGMLPPAPCSAPRPVAILMPGINVAPESYGWIARALAEVGFVAICYGWISEELPGLPALSPGLDVQALTPEDYGKRPSATALGALLADILAMNAAGPLAGQLDPERILLGGHSAGGSVALMNARPEWFPGVRAVFSYGSHSKASTMLGYAADTYLELPADVPTLILGGSEDGVIAASAFRYGQGDAPADPVGPLMRTFAEALPRQQGDSHLAILRGANHFSACWPADPATGRPFLDQPCTRDEAEIRRDLSKLICDFALARVQDDVEAEARLRQHLLNPLSCAAHSSK